MSAFYLPALGGVLIGWSAVMLLALNGRFAGVSGISAMLLKAKSFGDYSWRIGFLAGLVLGPLLLSLIFHFKSVGAPVASPGVLAFAGLLVGFGTVLGGGCTSGHGVCGIARLSTRSIAATLIFMAFAILTVYVVRHVG